jgi:hypothetical protein
VGRFAPKQPRAQRVERRNPHPTAIAAEQRLDARAHLLGGFIGKGHREDAAGVGHAFADQIGDAVRNDAGLARPCAGENEQRAMGMDDGVLLLGVQRGEEIQAPILP